MILLFSNNWIPVVAITVTSTIAAQSEAISIWKNHSAERHQVTVLSKKWQNAPIDGILAGKAISMASRILLDYWTATGHFTGMSFFVQKWRDDVDVHRCKALSQISVNLDRCPAQPFMRLWPINLWSRVDRNHHQQSDGIHGYFRYFHIRIKYHQISELSLSSLLVV